MKIHKEIHVLESNYPRFKKMLSKILKMYKVQKLEFKISPPETVFKEIEVPLQTGNQSLLSSPLTKKKMKYIKHEIIYDTLEFTQGFSVVGYLEKNKNEVLINLVDPSIEKLITKEILNSDMMCDHCNQKRGRKQVFVVYGSKDNKLMRLGTSCLQAYIPSTSESVLKLSAYTEEFFSSGWGGFVSGEYFKFYLPLFEFVIGCMEIIEDPEQGYIRYGEKEEYSTKNKAIQRIGSIEKNEDNLRKYAHFIQSILKSNSVDYSFRQNISVFHEEQQFLETYAERICYFVYKYISGLEKKASKEKKVSSSKYVGEIGERMLFKNVKYVSTHSFEDMYSNGVAYIHTFLSEEGDSLKYLGKIELLRLLNIEKEYQTSQEKEGEDISEETFAKRNTYNLSAVVKSHKEYQDVKQTTIKNIKIVEKD